MDTESTTAVTKTKASKPKTVVSALTLGNADDALTLATELQKFVKDNKLTSTIQGKQFPNVEAWQFAGTLLGLSPMLESIEDKSSEREIKWAATVQLINVRTEKVVGRGYATCSNLEHSKKSFADYAICSMAQTRAVGKAYRLTLGWLMKAAGYEATPAEEMQEAGTEATVVVEPAPTQRPPVAAPAPEASAPASVAPAPSATPAPSGEPAQMVVRASEADIQKLIQLIANPLLDAEERSMLLSKPVDQRPKDWVENTLTKLSALLIERRDPKKALEAAQNQLRTAATKYATQLGEAEYKNWMLRATSLTAKPEELRAEARQILAYYQSAA